MEPVERMQQLGFTRRDESMEFEDIFKACDYDLTNSHMNTFLLGQFLSPTGQLLDRKFTGTIKGVSSQAGLALFIQSTLWGASTLPTLIEWSMLTLVLSLFLGLSAQSHKRIAAAVKRARSMGLLPYLNRPVFVSSETMN